MEHSLDDLNMTSKERRKKKREARKALVFFLKRGCKACSAYGTVHEWYADMKKLKGVIEKYSDVLPEPELSKINNVLGMIDLADSGISNVCTVLKHDVRGLVKKLPMLSGASSLLLKGVLGVAVVAGGAAIVWNANKVKLTIQNNGCAPVPVTSKLPKGFAGFIDKLGIKLPLWIGTNGSESFALPPVSLDVRSSGRSMELRLLGQSMGFSIPTDVVSITFNSKELLGSDSTLNFREQKNHTIVVKCEWPKTSELYNKYTFVRDMRRNPDRTRQENVYDIQNELGPKNRFDRLAGEGQTVGSVFKDTNLEVKSRELAQKIRTIRYDSDQFYQVIVETDAIQRRLKELETSGAHTLETIVDQHDQSATPWKYLWERQAHGYRLVLDKWNTTWEEVQKVGAALKRKLESFLDEHVGVSQLASSTKKKDFGFCSYEDTDYSDGQRNIRKRTQFHKHGSSDIGYRTIYFFPDTLLSEPKAEKFWKEVKTFLIEVAVPISEEGMLPESWEYPGYGSRIVVPKGSELLEAHEDEKAKLRLFHIPSDRFRLKDSPEEQASDTYTLGEDIESNPHAYAITNEHNAIAIMMLADTEINDSITLKQFIDTQVGIKDERRISYFSKIPVIYDHASHWLFFPVSKKTIDELAEGHKHGISGTHYTVHKQNTFMNALCGGLKIEDLSNSDDLAGVTYFDLTRAHDGSVYIDANAARLGPTITEGLRLLGVHTSDEMPVFQGKGSLFDIIRTFTGKRLEDEDEQHVRWEVESVLKNSWKDAGRDFPGGRIELWLNRYLDRRRQLKLDFDISGHLYNLASNYVEHGGVPASAILSMRRDSQGGEEYIFAISGDHPDTERRLAEQYHDALFLARIDGVLKVRPQHGRQHDMLNFDYYPVHVTNREGGMLSGEANDAVMEALNKLSKDSLQDMEKYERGVVLYPLTYANR